MEKVRQYTGDLDTEDIYIQKFKLNLQNCAVKNAFNLQSNSTVARKHVTYFPFSDARMESRKIFWEDPQLVKGRRLEFPRDTGSRPQRVRATTMASSSTCTATAACPGDHLTTRFVEWQWLNA